jgi:hypothetical protein
MNESHTAQVSQVPNNAIDTRSLYAAHAMQALMAIHPDVFKSSLDNPNNTKGLARKLATIAFIVADEMREARNKT